jgi:hypothetical protein
LPGEDPAHLQTACLRDKADMTENASQPKIDIFWFNLSLSISFLDDFWLQKAKGVFRMNR